jgi:hypothetical protein
MRAPKGASDCVPTSIRQEMDVASGLAGGSPVAPVYRQWRRNHQAGRCRERQRKSSKRVQASWLLSVPPHRLRYCPPNNPGTRGRFGTRPTSRHPVTQRRRRAARRRGGWDLTPAPLPSRERGFARARGRERVRSRPSPAVRVALAAVAYSSRDESASYRGRNATARSGAPEPPAIFMGSATTHAPRSGNASRWSRFSRPGTLAPIATRWTMKSFDGP